MRGFWLLNGRRMLLLILVAISSRRIARWEAALLVLGYGGYVVYQLRTLA